MKLPRRVSLGIALPADLAFTPRGMRVAGVVPGSMADAAGLLPGDLLVALAPPIMPLRSPEELRVATRYAAFVETITFLVERAGVSFEREVRVTKCPVETLFGHEVHYDHVSAGGARLRTIITRPIAPARHPAVLFLQGIARDSLDFAANPDAPLGLLIQGWAREGFVTMRVDKRGVGDSDGEEAGFEADVDGYREGLDALAAYDFVDPGAIFLFGHSVGGMIAPLLAGERSTRGVMVYGTSAARWSVCLEASTRRQLALRGEGASEIERAVAHERSELFGAGSGAYHAELEARDLAAAWGKVTCPALVILGEHDWVVGEDEQLAIAARASAEVLRLPGTDHLMTRHASLEESLRAYGRGDFDERLVRETAIWMRQQMHRKTRRQGGD